MVFHPNFMLCTLARVNMESQTYMYNIMGLCSFSICPIQNQDYNLEFGLPLGCTKDNCTYYVAMGPNTEDGEFLDVYLQGTTEGWVAVGFSHTKLMVCVDAAT